MDIKGNVIAMLSASMLFSAASMALEIQEKNSAVLGSNAAQVSGYSLNLAPGNHVIIVNGQKRQLLKVQSKGQQAMQIEASPSAIPYIDISLNPPTINRSI